MVKLLNQVAPTIQQDDGTLKPGVFFMSEDLAKPRVDTPAEPPASGDTPASKTADSIAESELYATYEMDHNRPYLAEYFDIGDLWNNPDLTYKDEVGAIDKYLKSEIADKTLANTTKAVKDRVSQLERLAGVSPNASPALRVQQLAAFADYMSKLSSINLKVKLDV